MFTEDFFRRQKNDVKAAIIKNVHLHHQGVLNFSPEPECYIPLMSTHETTTPTCVAYENPQFTVYRQQTLHNISVLSGSASATPLERFFWEIERLAVTQGKDKNDPDFLAFAVDGFAHFLQTTMTAADPKIPQISTDEILEMVDKEFSKCPEMNRVVKAAKRNLSAYALFSSHPKTVFRSNVLG